MATLQDQIAALNDAIASGARSVTLDGQTVIYNTTQSLQAARDDLVKQLRVQTAAATGVEGRPRQTYATYSGRGFN